MEHTLKRCTTCGASKALSEFSPNSGGKFKVSSLCKPCARTIASARRKDNPEWAKMVDMKHSLKRDYGMSMEDYTEMDRLQGGVCDICHRPNSNGRRLYVDHDHTTGAVRALVCHYCNTMLGMADDNSDRLRTAAAYLDRHRSA